MDKQIKKYLSEVKRRLNLPKKIRTRLLSDLQSTIDARLEQGENWDTIRESLGTPSRVAAEYTQQMEEFAYRKSPWRFAFLGADVILGLKMLRSFVMNFFIAPTLESEMNGITFVMKEVNGHLTYGMVATAKMSLLTFLTAISDEILIFVICLLIYLRLRKCKQK